MRNLPHALLIRGPVLIGLGLGLLICACAVAPLGAAEVGLNPALLQQISALLEEKETRTPAQQKLDSHLLYAIKMSRNEVLAQGINNLRLSFTPDANGRALVHIQGQVTDALLAAIRQSSEITGIYRQYRAVQAWVPLNSMEALAAQPDIAFIRPADLPKHDVGRLVTEGDTTHRVGQARTNFSIMGQGVKVGVISDSVDFLTQSQNSGDVPAVTVLPGRAGFGAGEGTAMLEIIADLVPKAELFFSTAGFSPMDMAQNIIDLRLAGCDIIVDDIIFGTEPPFQDGPIAQAVNTVTGNGAMYFASGGNRGSKKKGTSSTWEGDFKSGGNITLSNRMGVAHDFGTNNITNIVPMGGGGASAYLHWADPLGGSTNDYDLFIVDPNGNAVLAASTTVQNGNDDPIENAGVIFDGQAVIIVRITGEARFMHLELFNGGRWTFSTGGSTRGHNSATNAFGCAAVPVQSAFPNAFSGGAANPTADFSSDGPRRVFYDAAGVPYNPTNFTSTGGSVRVKPDVAAATGVMTTVPGFNPFFGTSASAPHAAAMTALIKSYNPALTPDQIRAAITNSTLDIEDPGVDPNSGYGLFDPFTALSRLPPPLPSLVASNLSGGNGNGVFDFNECNELELVLKNNAITTASSVSASLVTTTPGVTIFNPTARYPNIPAGALATNITPFRVYVGQGFVCGTPIDFTLFISSSLGGVTNSFSMSSGTLGLVPVQFQGTNVVANIPDLDTNGVTVLIPVTGLAFPIGKVVVDLHIAHPAVGQLSVDLFAPDNTRVQLSRFRGGTNANFGLNCQQRTVFDDAAPTSITAAFPPFLGAFQPFTPLSVLGGKLGTNVNELWRLRVRDFDAGLTGSVQCVTLSIFPALCTDGASDCTADIGVTATDDPDPVLVSSNLTYTLVVTNHTPRLAPATMLTNILPPGVVVSFPPASTRGSCNVSGGRVTCDLGTIPGNGSATVRIVVRPSAAGLITNLVEVNTLAMDTNLLNNSATLVTTVQNPMPVIVPFATSVVAESGPVNGGLEPGETVTINFYLRNVGTLSTTNLVAKLLPTGGVRNPSEQTNYGALIPFGQATARPFTFEASGTNGSVITATFQLQEGSTNVGAPLGFVSFALGLGGAGTLANQSVIGIPFSGPAALYPSSVLVSGVAGVVNNVTVTLSNLNHSFPADMDVLLVAPTGQKVLLMSDAGASVGVTNAVLKFDDLASVLLPQEGPILSGTYRPTDYTDLPPADADTFPLPAPSGPYATQLAAFNGANANGLWSLYVLDDFAGDNGRIAGGWHLAFSTIDPLNPNADLAVSIVDSPDPVMLGSDVTYTVTVTNHGPEVALDVLLATTLPSGMSFVSSAIQQGSCSNDNGIVRCDVGSLPRSNSVAVTIVATALGVGTRTITANASGSVVDFNSANNTVTETTFIQANADLAIGMVTTPAVANVNDPLTYTITVNNFGPNHANGVTVTNVLPLGVVFVGAGGSQGACSEVNGVVTCALGSIQNGAQASVVVVINAPSGVGPLTASAGVGAVSPPDPDLANNQVTLTTSNINPSFIIVPAMTFLVSESGPVTGGIDPNETVNVTFELRNVGTLPTTTLVATLVPGGGVVPLTTERTYGVLEPMGAAVGQSFRFTAEGANGGLITATLHLQDGPFDLGNVSFVFPLGNVVRYTSPGLVDVPEFGPVGLYPSTLSVSGLTGQISKVSVTLSNLSHTYPDDLDILLVAPNNSFAMLMSDAGGGNGLTDVTVTFDDAAPDALPDRFAILPGTYRPTDYDSADLLPPPAPAGPYQGYVLDVFNGIDPNGTWSLFIYDDTFSDEGRLGGGWSIEFTTVGVIDPEPALLVAGRISPAGRFEFVLKGQAGGRYVIQASPDMRSWTTIANTVLAPSNTILFADPAPAGSTPRFYRAFQVPSTQ